MIFIVLAIGILVLGIWYFEFRAFSVPVLYYHHVEPTDPVTPEVFEAQMRYLLSKGYHAISLKELHTFMTRTGTVPRKSFVLTFDDGFYCNYHYVLPILKKYGLKAVVFVVSGVREQSITAGGESGQRERSRGYPSRTGNNRGAAERFATWDELTAMMQSGLVEIEDHSMFHDRVFRNDRARGFNTGVELDWPVWGDTRPGTVRYESGSSIIFNMFTGDYKLNDHLAAFVKEHSLDLSEAGAMQELSTAYLTYKKQNPVKVIYESDANYSRRCTMELQKSRELIAQRTGVVPGFLCFPWGQYNARAVRMVKEIGYRGAVTTDKGANVRGGDPYRIKRFKVYRSHLPWFRRYFFLHRSRILATLYGLIYGWF